MSKSPKLTKKRTSHIIFFSVLAVIAAYFISLDLQYRTAFTKVSNESLRIEQIGIKPLENKFVKETARGDGLLSRIRCIPDVQCPTMQKRWHVAVNSGQEEQVLNGVLLKSGYDANVVCAANICVGGSDGGEFSVSASLNKEPVSVALADGATRTWEELIINIELSNSK